MDTEDRQIPGACADTVSGEWCSTARLQRFQGRAGERSLGQHAQTTPQRRSPEEEGREAEREAGGERGFGLLLVLKDGGVVYLYAAENGH